MGPRLRRGTKGWPMCEEMDAAIWLTWLGARPMPKRPPSTELEAWLKLNRCC